MRGWPQEIEVNLNQYWKREDLKRWLKNARKRFAYWNSGCRRTSAKAHEKKELYAADIDRLKQILHR